MQKMLSSIVILGLLLSVSVAAQEKLPFVGKKFFNFMGGTGTGQFIVIKANGNTVVEGCAAGELGGQCVIDFKGKFTNPIKLKKGGGYLFKDGKIYLLDENGEIDKDCMNNGELCVSELDSE